jgi:aspartate carbamoyltransferase regulatory subunit
MPIDKPTRDEEKNYKIYPVETGTVIDHIKPLGAYHISRILRLEEKGDRARMASRIESRRMGEKDMLMIDDRELTDKEKSILALVAPESTINYIKEKNVVKKGKLLLPATIKGVKRIQCANASCVSRPEYNEHAPTKFHTVSRKPPIMRCHYCDTLMGQDEMVWK